MALDDPRRLTISDIIRQVHERYGRPAVLTETGSYEENYYRYLNVGLRLPISTGTDWFLYDFARVYAGVPGKLTMFVLPSEKRP